MDKGSNDIKEENPFEDPQVAKEWITSVENERGMIRDNEIYPRLRQWAEGVRPGVIVDIGAGQGVCAEKIDLHGGRYIGIEPSVPLVRRAEQLYQGDQYTFIVGGAYALPVESASADAAFSVNVWFHLADPGIASRELQRILRPGGKFMIVTANPDLYHVWESFYFDEHREGKKIVGKAKIPIKNLSRNTFYEHSEREVTEALEKSGLAVARIERFGAAKENNDGGLFLSIEGHRPGN